MNLMQSVQVIFASILSCWNKITLLLASKNDKLILYLNKASMWLDRFTTNEKSEYIQDNHRSP
jgi:hypothetical protein